MPWRFLAKRLGFAVLLLVGVVLVGFLITAILPSNPAQAQLGEQAAADPEVVAAYEAQHGLDKPLPQQFLVYVGNVLHGDLGTSLRTHNPVSQDLAEFGPASAELALAATVIALIIGVGFGIVAALKRDRPVDQALRVFSLGGVSVPVFWLSLVAIYLLSFRIPIFPSGGRLDPGATPPPQITGMYTVDSILSGQWATFGSAVAHLILPALVLSGPMIGLLLRFTRSSMLEVLGNDYVRAAQAKGLPGGVVVRRHVLRAALVPVITVLGTAFASLLAGTVLVEKIFAWPGIGQYAYLSATNLDLLAIVGVMAFVAVIYISINLIVDLLYGVIDPRIRVS